MKEMLKKGKKMFGYSDNYGNGQQALGNEIVQEKKRKEKIILGIFVGVALIALNVLLYFMSQV